MNSFDKEKRRETVKRGRDDESCTLFKVDGNSKAWVTFRKVMEGENFTGLVFCTNCKEVLQYEGEKGTKGMPALIEVMLRHLESIRCSSYLKEAESGTEKNQTSLDSFCEKKNLHPSIIPKVTDALMDVFIKDLRPFYLVDGEGFRNFCQCLLEIGSVFGKMNVEQLLLSSQTDGKEIFINVAPGN